MDESGNVTEVTSRTSFVDKSLVKRDSSSCYSVLSKDCTLGVTKEFKTVSFTVGVNCDHTSDLLCTSVTLSETEKVLTEELKFFEEASSKRISSDKLVFLCDQDEGSTNAISNVFGDRALVRLCLYHLTQNFVQRLGGALSGLKEFDLSVPPETMSKDGLLVLAKAYDLKLSSKPKSEVLEAVTKAIEEDKGKKLGTQFSISSYPLIYYHILSYTLIYSHIFSYILIYSHILSYTLIYYQCHITLTT